MTNPNPVVALIEAIGELMAENLALREQVERLKASANNGPKLNAADVEAIKQLRREGSTVAEIAEIYDVNKSTISRTLRGIYH